MFYKIVIRFTALLIAFSAIAEIIFPANMLTFVGIDSNLQTNFLLRTTAVALISFLPGLWSARNEINSPATRNAILGIAMYMFLSSIIDYQAFTQAVVNQMSVPSVIFRCLLGIILLWFVFRKS
jgi:hypothetical protein